MTYYNKRTHDNNSGIVYDLKIGNGTLEQCLNYTIKFEKKIDFVNS